MLSLDLFGSEIWRDLVLFSLIHGPRLLRSDYSRRLSFLHDLGRPVRVSKPYIAGKKDARHTVHHYPLNPLIINVLTQPFRFRDVARLGPVLPDPWPEAAEARLLPQAVFFSMS
jgi:hypothetical protein